MTTKISEPKWILTEDWGINIDSLNWKLYKRRHNKKTGEPAGWGIVGYYPTLNMLAKSLSEKVLLEDTQAETIVQHLIHALASIQRLLGALKREMGTMDRVGLDTKPPGYRKYVHEGDSND